MIRVDDDVEEEMTIGREAEDGWGLGLGDKTLADGWGLGDR